MKTPWLQAFSTATLLSSYLYMKTAHDFMEQAGAYLTPHSSLEGNVR
eukprot:CAMPEP_0172685224 /NCGR_PEP_ID=MMETSP1074-20121228/20089_1 /TAXON_ID=2916 /ORGANISM="Ceratium fusus, Strain PA161109" /LENGTH=46 /DNA_ID= /DNA_START= /DNA_END= /DNA_ORIENTATION=